MPGLGTDPSSLRELGMSWLCLPTWKGHRFSDKQTGIEQILVFNKVISISLTTSGSQSSGIPESGTWVPAELDPLLP